MMPNAIYRYSWTLLIFACAGNLFVGCSKPAPPVDPVVHRKEIEEWQKTRLVKLTSETGWLTLAGLSWLGQGENLVGSDSTSRVLLPAKKTPALVGTITLTGEKTSFKAARGVKVYHNDSAVTELAMASDAESDPTTLKVGTVSFYVIKRGTQMGVRVKDSENPARLNFQGLEYFPTDPRFRIQAKFIPYKPPKMLEIPSQAGTVETDSCPGALSFEIDGTEFRIDAIVEQGAENQFFIMFTDATSGVETYAVGRQLYTSLPDSNNMVILDFNKAYNWPCVFTDFATCPIPPRQNRITVRIEAGEKMYKGHGQ